MGMRVTFPTVVVVVLASTSTGAHAQVRESLSGTYELTWFSRNTVTNEPTRSQVIVVLASVPFPDSVSRRLTPGVRRPTAPPRACWRLVDGELPMNAGRPTSTDWLVRRDTITMTLWFIVDAGTTLRFWLGPGGMRGDATSSGWMAVPGGGAAPQTLRDSVVGRRVGDADPLRCLLTATPPPAQQAPPRFLYIYRDSLRDGVDSAYDAIENDAARICDDFRCPNPYLGLRSLSGTHEAWWINTFQGEADSARVASAYARNGALMGALRAITERKTGLVGRPIEGFAVHRPDLSRGPAWSVTGARFLVVTVTRRRRPSWGSVWETADSTLYVMRLVRTRAQAETLGRRQGARIFAVRPNWSMPAPEWVAADSLFWRRVP